MEFILGFIAGMGVGFILAGLFLNAVDRDEGK